MHAILRNKIENSDRNMITYADYIQTALYHPEQGYYMNEQVKIGTKGDFITSSNVSDIFGEIIGKWYSRIYRKLDLPASVCEMGAGNGRFAQAFIKGWHRCSDMPLTYSIIETSPFHRKLQAEALDHLSNVTQYNDIDDLPQFEGLFFSNELFDALPVHVIEKKEDKLFEVMITIEGERLAERLAPLENQEILKFIRVQGIHLLDGQRMEIPLEMERVIKKIGSALYRGIAVTADYGYSYEDWKHPARRNGSLRGYYQHQMIEDILKHPGRMDITSHVHFDALIQQGESLGLRLLSILRQNEFLMKAGILEELEEHYDLDPFSDTSRRNRAIRSLILPGGISSAFHVIVQGKGTGSGTRVTDILG
ncbi:SAM-dependent methyltransferase [Mesobacillus foraminis]|uniref:class I SAM-dependent methyltransferase n=1 Tax=Mesobacillus foraminis TaxID=279826 RepID=UPI001BE5D266|nr:SAM-dependent methyltransferase [Mesobacillus foraminis]MBT2754745.1 SAM-dependent methyltransferase [Mesobacillus foraminis]